MNRNISDSTEESCGQNLKVNKKMSGWFGDHHDNTATSLGEWLR